MLVFAVIITFNLMGRLLTRFRSMALGICLFNCISIEVQSVFMLIPKVFSVVEIRALQGPLKFFHTSVGKSSVFGKSSFMHRGIVMLEEVWIQ